MGYPDGLNLRLPGSRPRPAGMRAAAEQHAASLGLSRGGPGWGAAIRDFVMKGGEGEPDGARAQAKNPIGPVQYVNPMSFGIGGGRVEQDNFDLGGFAGRAASSPAYNPAAQPSPHVDRLTPDHIAVGSSGPIRPPAPQPAIPLRDGSMAGRDDLNPVSLAMGPPASAPRKTKAPARPAPPSPEDVQQTIRSYLPPMLRDLPTGPDPKPEFFPRELTTLSARYEDSRARGAGAISSGENDPGGVSYGSVQLSSNRGTAKAFVQSPEAGRWAKEFAGLQPGTEAFSEKWAEIADREPQALDDASLRYIERTHYRVAVSRALDATALNLDKRAGAVRAAVWSTAIQHGAYTDLLASAV